MRTGIEMEMERPGDRVGMKLRLSFGRGDGSEDGL